MAFDLEAMRRAAKENPEYMGSVLECCDELERLKHQVRDWTEASFSAIQRAQKSEAERDAARAEAAAWNEAFEKLYLDAEDGGLMHGDLEHRAWLEAHLNKSRAALSLPRSRNE